ncbi:MAG: Oxidoreductase, partial [uncultured Blastococcus sp.]
ARTARPARTADRPDHRRLQRHRSRERTGAGGARCASAPRGAWPSGARGGRPRGARGRRRRGAGLPGGRARRGRAPRRGGHGGGTLRPARPGRPLRRGHGVRTDRGRSAGDLPAGRRHLAARHRQSGPRRAAGLPGAAGRAPGGGEFAARQRRGAADGQLRRGEVGAARAGAHPAAGGPRRAGHLDLARPAGRRRHAHLLPGRDVDGQHRPATAAGVLPAAGGARGAVHRGPAAARGAGRAVQPADHRRLPPGAGRLRPPGRAAPDPHGGGERRRAADRGQRLRVPPGGQRHRRPLAQHL